MEIVISIPDEVGRQLLSRATKEGLGVSDFVAKVARREAKRATLEESRPSPNVNWQEKSDKLRQAMTWIKAHRAEYAGQWVCLDGDQLISHGSEAKKVYAEADAKNISSPFVEYIEKDNLPFGGW